MNRILAQLKLSMEKRLNVLLCGYHGVGKTQIVREEAQRQGLVLKYYSASTLDPWADLVGIPVPVLSNRRRRLEYVRPADLDAAEIIFFDELNRSHPKTQNAVLELIQFRSINGAPLPKLRMVWAAINPIDDVYAVTELDVALKDRFEVHLNVRSAPSADYYHHRAGLPMHVAKSLVLWWERDLNDDLRKVISPRRLEYIGISYITGLGLDCAVPLGVKVPVQNLLARLERPSPLPFELTRETLRSRQDEILAEMKSSAEIAISIHERLEEWPDVVPDCIPLFLGLPSEFQKKLLLETTIRQKLTSLARDKRAAGAPDLRPLADRLIAIGALERQQE